MFLALYANLIVDRDYGTCSRFGLTVQIIEVNELPPKADLKT
jgi:hypothetical protein